MAAAAHRSGKPVCPCGQSELSNLSPSLQRTWAASGGEKWYYLRAGHTAFFRYCRTCHQELWPEDKRQQGAAVVEVVFYGRGCEQAALWRLLLDPGARGADCAGPGGSQGHSGKAPSALTAPLA